METPRTPELTSRTTPLVQESLRAFGRARSKPLLTPFDTGDIEFPAEFPSPFDELGPHPLAERAAHILQDELRGGVAGSIHEGKMFGVLVVRTRAGEVGFLRSFSGTLGGRFDVRGFVPPIFNRKARANVEVPGERLVKELSGRAWDYAFSANLPSVLREKAKVLHGRQLVMNEVRAQHLVNKHERRLERVSLDAESADGGSRLRELAQESRRDKAELRALQAAQAELSSGFDDQVRRIERRMAAHARLQRSVSRRLMKQIHDTYRLTNARGVIRHLRELFPNAEPPGGAGDCAAPKLLSYAILHGYKPLAMAEFWWGPPPAGGGRVAGEFYPSCKEKCGPVLPFLLDGIHVAPTRRFSPPDASALDLPVLHEDDHVIVVEKPAGLLSVPPRKGPRDSVLTRLEQKYPGVRLVHRLDLDTSGVLVAARSAWVHSALQRQFLRRKVRKCYVAVVDGTVAGDKGTIDLAIRVDIGDRPRHIHDPEHGRRAITRWEVLGRVDDGTTRIAFFPVTGRTHQLRVHASHPLGLGAPIVGDRLYGRGGKRLLLHAESIELEHPGTGQKLRVESPAPF
jgi:tRNA pseudouridine32 synthase / 23S rRNA pseudouridine746 synthase